MRSGLLLRACWWLMMAVLLFPAASAHAQSSASANASTFEAQLIWGTNDKQSDPKLKAADSKLAEKLRKTPFKWDHYFEMHKETIKLRLNEEKTVTMSRNCVISLTYLKDENIKFQLFGKGQLANTVTQPLPKGRLLVEGGDAENSTAWFVVLKQVD